MNRWYDAEGNFFKLKEKDGKVLLRAYRKTENGKGEKGITRESYRLDPKLLKTEMVDGVMKIEYDDFFIEPYATGMNPNDEFGMEADEEYEKGVAAIPAGVFPLVCSIEEI